MKITYLEEGLFKTPAQMKAAAEERDALSDEELVAQENSAVWSKTFEKICNEILIYGHAYYRNCRIVNTKFSDNVLEFDFEYVEWSNDYGAKNKEKFLTFDLISKKSANNALPNAVIKGPIENWIKPEHVKKEADAIKSRIIYSLMSSATLMNRKSAEGSEEKIVCTFILDKLNQIIIRNIFVLFEYNDIFIKPMFPVLYIPGKPDAIPEEEDFHVTDKYTENDIKQIVKNLTKYFVFRNTGKIQVQTTTDVLKDYSDTADDTVCKSLIRSALKFSYRQYERYLYNKVYAAKTWAEKMAEIFAQNPKYTDAKKAKDEYLEVDSLAKSYTQYIRKQENLYYSSTFQILKVGIACHIINAFVFDKETGEMLRKTNDLETNEGKYLRLVRDGFIPRFFIKYTLDGEFEETIGFVPSDYDKDRIDFYFRNSKEKTEKYLTYDKYTKPEDNSLATRLFDTEAKDRYNSDYISDMRDFAKTTEYEWIARFIKGTLYLM